MKADDDNDDGVALAAVAASRAMQEKVESFLVAGLNLHHCSLLFNMSHDLDLGLEFMNIHFCFMITKGLWSF